MLLHQHILELEIVEDDKLIWTLLRAGNAYVGLHKIGDQYFLSKIKEGHKFDSNAKIVFQIEEDISKVRQVLLDKNVSMREKKLSKITIIDSVMEKTLKGIFFN